MATFDVGTLVQAVYKTGVYVGEIVEVRSSKAVVKILAVLKHPAQGDLHQPFEANVTMFHQRKALACHEKSLIPFPYLRPYEGEVPDYTQSLKKALKDEVESLKERGDEWAKRGISELEQLEKDYFPRK